MRDRAATSLRCLLTQSIGPRLEVLIIDCAGAGYPALQGSEDPRVRVLTLPPGTTFARARAAGLAQASAEVVVFVEEHVRVRPGWAMALLTAYDEGGWSGVGGVPLPGSSDPLGLIIHVMTYGDWLPPVPRGEVTWLPGHNASFRAQALRDLGADLERYLACDLVLHDRLRSLGHRLAMEPKAEFEHLGEASTSVLARGLFYWYRCYSPLRAAEGRWSLARRLGYVLATPLVPVYALRVFRRRLRRLNGSGVRDGSGPLRAGVPRHLFWRHLPSVLWMQLAGASGQALGLLFGPGDAPRRFSDFELHAPRRERPVVAAPASS